MCITHWSVFALNGCVLTRACNAHSSAVNCTCAQLSIGESLLLNMSRTLLLCLLFLPLGTAHHTNPLSRLNTKEINAILSNLTNGLEPFDHMIRPGAGGNATYVTVDVHIPHINNVDFDQMVCLLSMCLCEY